jgi:hypothetical protein
MKDDPYQLRRPPSRLRFHLRSWRPSRWNRAGCRFRA